jgi:hypothetical protein
MEYVALIILLGLFGGSLFVIRNLIIKLEDADDAIEEADEYVKEMEEWITTFRSQVTEAYDKMKQLDTKGAFESEDEVGSVFKGLSDIIYKLNEITNTEDETE